MRIRYVLGSIAWPKEPRRLKSGQLSTDKAQQVMAWQYKAACLADALEMDAETFAAFQERDKAAWGYRLDIWSSSKRQASLVRSRKSQAPSSKHQASSRKRQAR